jgi:hypothetical protein
VVVLVVVVELVVQVKVEIKVVLKVMTVSASGAKKNFCPFTSATISFPGPSIPSSSS